MNPERIYFSTPDRRYSLPNRYELLTAEQYLYLMQLLAGWAAGSLTPIDVEALFACKCLDLDHQRIDDEGMPNLYQLACSIDFIFRYDKETKSYKPRQPYFAAQLLPSIELRGRTFTGYAVHTAGDMLSIELSALAFIDALDLLPLSDRSARLRLCLLLYKSMPYEPNRIHALSAKLAPELSPADELVLEAVAYQFAALAGYIFRLPYYSLLVPEGKQSSSSSAEDLPYKLGLSAALYKLCADGLGSKKEVEEMPLLDFLEQLRISTIRSVRQMHEMDSKLPDIAEATGLSIAQINRIIQAQ